MYSFFLFHRSDFLLQGTQGGGILQEIALCGFFQIALLAEICQYIQKMAVCHTQIFRRLRMPLPIDPISGGHQQKSRKAVLQGIGNALRIMEYGVQIFFAEEQTGVPQKFCIS